MTVCQRWFFIVISMCVCVLIVKVCGAMCFLPSSHNSIYHELPTKNKYSTKTYFKEVSSLKRNPKSAISTISSRANNALV